MRKQIYFYEMNSDVGNVLSEFLKSENLAFLFVSLYSNVKKIIPDVIIRGIPGQIFGVSRMKERCLFYVTSSPDQSFRIHFKGESCELIFSKENAGNIAELVFREIRRYKQNPRDYQINGVHFPIEPQITEPASSSSTNNQVQDEILDEISMISVDNEKSNGKSALIIETCVQSEGESAPETDQTGHEKSTHISKVYKDNFTDKEIECKVCGKKFIFSAGEQEYFYKNGLVDPKRCKSCRDKKQQLHEEAKYIGLGSITGKMGTKKSSYLDHAQTYGPSINVNSGLPNSPGFRRGREKNGTVEYTAKIGKKKITRKHYPDY